jgi:hypothetical protein
MKKKDMKSLYELMEKNPCIFNASVFTMNLKYVLRIRVLKRYGFFISTF